MLKKEKEMADRFQGRVKIFFLFLVNWRMGHMMLEKKIKKIIICEKFRRLDSILETSLGVDIVQNLFKLVVFKASFKTWNERFRFFSTIRTQISQSG